jgi:hypothetical protein
MGAGVMKAFICSDVHCELHPDGGWSLIRQLPEAEEIIAARRPRLWIHRHTNVTADYTIGPTRVLCSPYGYPRNANWGFRFQGVSL